MAQRGETPFSFNSGVLSQMPIGIRSQLAHVIMDTCYRLDPFRNIYGVVFRVPSPPMAHATF